MNSNLPHRGRGTSEAGGGAGGEFARNADLPLHHAAHGPPPPLGEVIARIELFAPPLIHRLVGRPYRPDAPPSWQRLCLPFLAPLMLRDGLIDPRRHKIDDALAAQVTVTLDGNPDGNAMVPQRLVVTMRDGRTIERAIPAVLGSPEAPMSPAQADAKTNLCRVLAPQADPRIFDAPLAYATEPR